MVSILLSIGCTWCQLCRLPPVCLSIAHRHSTMGLSPLCGQSVVLLDVQSDSVLKSPSALSRRKRRWLTSPSLGNPPGSIRSLHPPLAV